jgi:glycosyltransferase involved in cell wall biosynthesis
VKRHRLLLVSPCQGAYGGIEAFVLAVANAVRRESDFEVRVCFKKTRDFELKPSLREMLEEQAACFCERGGADLAAHVRWADVVHAQNAPPDVVMLAKLFRKPIALTIHNYMGEPMTLHRRLWKWSARIADARWYNSQFVWDTWEPHRKRRGSRKVPTVSTLPEGVAPIEQRAGFAFIGRWIANKGVDTLVDAYAIAQVDRQKWPLVLMGDGPLRGAIEQRIRDRELRSVELTGFIDEETKAERMRHARWVVVPPNTREDFGLTAIEARNLGVPCIITRDGGLPEAGGRQALICEPGDADALARTLERAAQMPDAEYAERATKTHTELATELEPIDFYAAAYRGLIGR